MTGTEVRFIDIAKITSNLRELSVSLDPITTAALGNAGGVIERIAKEKCPVDTGRLRASIWTNPDPVEVDGIRSVSIGTPVEYASFVEFGTGLCGENGRGITRSSLGGGRAWIGMSARPFLRPALSEGKEEAMKTFASVVNEAIFK